jgi:uncharacterized protein DUF6152
MRAKLTVVVTSIGLVFAAVPVVAHHAFAAEFDASKPIKLVGVVTKIEWMNPHTWFYIDVTDASGKVTNWGWEMGSPNGLIRAGWTRNSMKIGDSITVEGSGSRDGSNTANTRAVILNSTGQKLFAASSQGPVQQK